MNDDFGVGVRTKTMRIRFAFKFTAQIGEVVDLAVVGDPDRAVFVAHGHVAIGGKIENSKAAAAQTDVSAIGETPLPEAGVVGSAVRLHVRHPDERLPIAAVHESADAAHALSSSRCSQLVDFRLGMEHLHRLKGTVDQARHAIEKSQSKKITI